MLEAYNLIKLIIKTLNHVPFCLSVLKTLLVSFSVTPPPLPLRLPRYYGHFILATWQNGSCSNSTAIHFLVKKKVVNTAKCFWTIGAVLAIYNKPEHSHTKPNTMWEDSLVGVPGKDFPHRNGEEVGGRSASERAVACSRLRVSQVR